MKKKTLYEILGVSANASLSEIEAAYSQATLELLQQQKAGFSEDLGLQAKLLAFARETLTDHVARRNYDEQLMARGAGGASVPGSPDPLLLPGADSLAGRVDAMALRADAMALRADAMAMRSDLHSIGSENKLRRLSSRIFALVESPIRILITTIGLLAALGIVANMYFVYSSLQRAERAAVQKAKADEQLVIEDYYRKHGVRPASAAEATLLERESRRREAEERDAERQRQKAEEDARRFEEESRRQADHISADLRRAEEAARREERMEEMRAKEEARQKEREEIARRERQQWEWRRVLTR